MRVVILVDKILFPLQYKGMNNTTNTSTGETTPFHIWAHEVEMAAIGKGADAEFLRTTAVRGRLIRAYSAGEPVWMMADEMALRSRGNAMAIRETKDGLALIARARRQPRG